MEEIRYQNDLWSAINTVLLRFPENDIVWIENFQEISLEGLSKKKIACLFNKDSVLWRLECDQDGVLYAINLTKLKNIK